MGKTWGAAAGGAHTRMFQIPQTSHTGTEIARDDHDVTGCRARAQHATRFMRIAQGSHIQNHARSARQIPADNSRSVGAGAIDQTRIEAIELFAAEDSGQSQADQKIARTSAHSGYIT